MIARIPLATIHRSILRLALTVAAAQLLPAQVIETKAGSMEFLGLKRWTAQRLLDSIEAHTPGAEENGPHACGAVLTGEMGFPDASVLGIPDSAGNMYWLVTVIEPEDSARVQYLPRPKRSDPSPDGWRQFAMLLDRSAMLDQSAIASYGQIMKGNRDSAIAMVTAWNGEMESVGRGSRYAVEEADSAWAFLSAHRSAADLKRALRMLKEDGNSTNRRIAALILSNFPEDDAAWNALLDAQRDSDRMQQVRTAAESVLQLFRQEDRRSVDWRPAGKSIRALLAGTNLFAFVSTLELLAATGVDPSLAEPVLRGNTDLMNAYLRASRPEVRDVARRVVGLLSGRPDATAEEQLAWLARFETR